MADGIDTAVEGVEKASADESGDRVRAESGLQELLPADHSFLAARQTCTHLDACNNVPIFLRCATSFTLSALWPYNVKGSLTWGKWCTFLRRGSHIGMSPGGAKTTP